MDPFLKLIIIIVIAVLAFVFVIKLIKGILKIVTGIILIVLLAVMIFGVISFLDLKEGFSEKKSIIMLEDENPIMFAEITTANLREEGAFKQLDDNVIRAEIATGNYSIKGYYKIIIMKESVLREGLPGKVRIPDTKINVTREEYINALSSDPNEFLSQITGKKIETTKEEMLGFGIKQILKEQKANYFLKKYKEDEIIIRPKSLGLGIFKKATMQFLGFAEK